jgi:hypothetical protein
MGSGAKVAWKRQIKNENGKGNGWGWVPKKDGVKMLRVEMLAK